ncbi:MAG: serine/threonine-protein kinase [Candidatus Micrarchaeota archaeon]
MDSGSPRLRNTPQGMRNGPPVRPVPRAMPAPLIDGEPARGAADLDIHISIQWDPKMQAQNLQVPPISPTGRYEGQLIGGSMSGKGYQISGRINSGGMAEVYLAKDDTTGETVAVKMARDDSMSPELANQWMAVEIMALSRLDHENIVRMKDYGSEGATPYIVMEYVEGATLKSAIGDEGLSLDETLSIMDQLLKGLKAVHEAGIVYRDLKPDNIMYYFSGDELRIKMLDFGIAKLSGQEDVVMEGVLTGTPAYLSPEQAGGLRVGPESDIHAVGVMLYEMLTGTDPFLDGDTDEMISRARFLIPEPPGAVARNVHPALDAITMMALDKKPENRPTLEEMQAVVEQCAGA